MVSAAANAGQTEERVMNVIKKFGSIDADKVTKEAHFTNDLGLDSLDTVELLMTIEDEFDIEIPDAKAEQIATVKDTVEYIVNNPKGGSK